MHSSGFFWDKAYCKVDFKCEISGSHAISDQSLLLSTIVLNDDNNGDSMRMLRYVTRAGTGSRETTLSVGLNLINSRIKGSPHIVALPQSLKQWIASGG